MEKVVYETPVPTMSSYAEEVDDKSKVEENVYNKLYVFDPAIPETSRPPSYVPMEVSYNNSDKLVQAIERLTKGLITVAVISIAVLVLCLVPTLYVLLETNGIAKSNLRNLKTSNIHTNNDKLKDPTSAKFRAEDGPMKQTEGEEAIFLRLPELEARIETMERKYETYEYDIDQIQFKQKERLKKIVLDMKLRDKTVLEKTTKNQSIILEAQSEKIKSLEEALLTISEQVLKLQQPIPMSLADSDRVIDKRNVKGNLVASKKKPQTVPKEKHSDSEKKYKFLEKVVEAFETLEDSSQHIPTSLIKPAGWKTNNSRADHQKQTNKPTTPKQKVKGSVRELKQNKTSQYDSYLLFLQMIERSNNLKSSGQVKQKPHALGHLLHEGYCTRNFPHTVCHPCKCQAHDIDNNEYVCDCTNLPIKRDCADYYNSGYRLDGIYTIRPDGWTNMTVVCDQTDDGGGWVVIQNRFDGSTGFYRNWKEYKTGFGQLHREFYLGNDNIHILTQYDRQLKVELETCTNSEFYANYDYFSIASEHDDYRLTISGYSGTAGDSFAYNSGMKFSTFDRDLDAWSGSCATYYTGAWWFPDCGYTNLNGQFFYPSVLLRAPYFQHVGITWYDVNEYIPLKGSRMKVRPLRPV